MGDRRFEGPYQKVLRATEPQAELAHLSDDEVVQALAHAAREHEPLLADVLATEALNRMRRSRLALRHLGEGVVTVDGAGRIRDVNPTAARIVGYERHELLGTHLHDVLHHEDADGQPIPRDECRPLRALLSGRDFTFERELFRHKDGSRLALSGVYAAYPGDGAAAGGGVVAFRDATQSQQRMDLERRYRKLVEESPLSIQTFTPNGKALDANAGWERLWGATRDARHGYNILQDEVLERLGVLRDLRRAFAGERVDLPTVRFDPAEVGREGRARWVKGVAYPLLDPQGRVLEVVVVHTDMTEDVEAREAMREKEEVHRLLVENVRDYAIYMVDTEGHIVSWNEGVHRIKGYRADEVIGKSIAMFYTPEDRARNEHRRTLEIAARAGTFRGEGWRVRRDGTRFWADVVVTALRGTEGELRGFAKITRDLTERKHSEEALRQSEERYRRLVHNSPAPMAVHRDGALVFVNEAAVRILGAQGPDDLMGRSVLDFVHPDSRAMVRERLRDIATSPGALPPAEEKLLRLDGRPIWAEVAAIPIDYDGHRAVQLVLRDVTAQKEAQDRMGEEAARLERRVQERTAQLEQAVRDLETFTNSASHDLRAPLRGVAELARALDEDAGDQLAPEARQLLKGIRQENQKASALVHALLAFARSGRANVEAGWVDVTRLAHDIASDIAQRHPERRAAWRIQDGMRAWADEGLLRIALNNLMSNASKYSDRRPEPLVRVEGEMTGSEAVVRVHDNGVGFPPQEAYRLFAPFHRLSTARGFEGTGLGLAAVHRIVTRHGGRVWAQSEHEEGATFAFALPLPAGDGRSAGAAE